MMEGEGGVQSPERGQSFLFSCVRRPVSFNALVVDVLPDSLI